MSEKASWKERFLEKNLEALEHNKTAQESWEGKIKEYSTLREKIDRLPNDISPKCVIPVAHNMGLLKGQMVHTNEILVHLGDGWFAERSANQACEIADRRINYIKDIQKKLKEEAILLQQRIEHSNDDADQFVEEYDEAKEKEWLARHEEAVRMEKHDVMPEIENKNNPDLDSYWKRLDELELADLGNDDGRRRKSVSFGERDVIIDHEKLINRSTILFNHSNEPSGVLPGVESIDNEFHHRSGSISSPRDVDKLVPRKSILKSHEDGEGGDGSMEAEGERVATSVPDVIPPVIITSDDNNEPHSSEHAAFLHAIKEHRNVDGVEIRADKDITPNLVEEVEKEEIEEKKPVSLFKQRMSSKTAP